MACFRVACATAHGKKARFMPCKTEAKRGETAAKGRAANIVEKRLVRVRQAANSSYGKWPGSVEAVNELTTMVVAALTHPSEIGLTIFSFVENDRTGQLAMPTLAGSAPVVKGCWA